MCISMTILIDERHGRIDGRIGTPGRGRSIEVVIGTPTRLVATRAASTTEDRRSWVGLTGTLLMRLDTRRRRATTLPGCAGAQSYV